MNCTNKPGAIAHVRGGDQYPDLQGTVAFYPKPKGILLVAKLRGLPLSETGFFGFHIHEGENCGGQDFEGTGSHYDPEGTNHPRHAGDLPPLLSAGGTALLQVFSNRFTLKDILGRTVVIHSHPDDFTTPPAGNAGTKIACGVIRKTGVM